jgi:hypothetical protein
MLQRVYQAQPVREFTAAFAKLSAGFAAFGVRSRLRISALRSTVLTTVETDPVGAMERRTLGSSVHCLTNLRKLRETHDCGEFLGRAFLRHSCRGVATPIFLAISMTSPSFSLCLVTNRLRAPTLCNIGGQADQAVRQECL